jgi:serine protease AprX
VEGMAWAIERGADIINLSLGMEYYEPLFSKVLDILISQYNVLPIVAIGNSNHGNTSSPGNSYNAFSVGAIEQMAEDQLGVTFFSSGASLVFPGQAPEAIVTKPDVVAPGCQVYSCIPPEQRPGGSFAYSYMDGTSMAAPHLSGVAALLMAANPDGSVTDVIKALRETALHPNGGDRRPDNRWGYGLIQPAEALKLIQMA